MSKKTDLQYRRRWGIPDWRNSKAYPASLPDELWRWEFLRRCDDYRQDWEREHKRTVEWYSKHTYQEWMSPNPNSDLESPGPIEPGNFDCDPGSEEFVVYMKHSVKKYRMPVLINPAVARPRNLGFWSVHLIEAGDYVFAPMALALDPNASLEAHIEILKIGLKQVGQNKDKPHVPDWAKYLRTLDAKAVGAKNDEILLVLEPKKMAYNSGTPANDWMRAATKLQERLIRPTK
ncbi:MAG: hypothetical protein LAP85_10565 [Acidobacteriia bacterium]|nr:hypothetical protein [Terriglobia bacterium]